MSHMSEGMRNAFAGFGLIMFLLITAFVVMVMWKFPIHQFNLWRLGRNFRAVESYHPEDSKYLLSVGDFGNLFRATSNGCDYLVGEVRSGKGSQEDIARHYTDLFVKAFDNSEPVPAELHFFNDENWMDPYDWSRWRDQAEPYAGTGAVRGVLYMVFARQTDYPPDGDIRCH